MCVCVYDNSRAVSEFKQGRVIMMNSIWRPFGAGKALKNDSVPPVHKEVRPGSSGFRTRRHALPIPALHGSSAELIDSASIYINAAGRVAK